MSRTSRWPDRRLPRWARVALALLVFAPAASPRWGQAPDGGGPDRRVLAGEDAEKVGALDKQLSALRIEGKFAEAVGPAREILSIRRRVQGDAHWATVEARVHEETAVRIAAMPPADRAAMAESLRLTSSAKEQWRKGRYAEARPLEERALEIERRLLGDDHPDTAASFNFLGMILDAMGHHAEAAADYEKALATLKKVLGENHPSAATVASNLALNLNAQARYAEAQPVFERALAIHRKVLGEESDSTAMSYNNVAFNLYAQGRYAEAQPVLERALAIRRKLVGDEDTETGSGYANVAGNLNAQGRYAEAQPMFERALAIHRKVLGEEHPTTAESLRNLAFNLNSQARYAEAEPYARQALAILRKTLGEEHPGVAVAYNNLAYSLNAQGRYAEAQPMAERALAIRRKAMGDDHPETANSDVNLAANLDAQGHHAEARRLLERALAIRVAAIGDDHPDSVLVRNRLADNLHATGDDAGAEKNWTIAAEAFDRVRGRIAPTGLDRSGAASRISPFSSLACLLARRGAMAEAWSRYEHDLARGLLDDLSVRQARRVGDDDRRREQELRGRLKRLDAAAAVPGRPAADRDRLAQDRLEAQAEWSAFQRHLQEVYGVAGGEVFALGRIQERLPDDAAIVGWIDLETRPGAADPRGDHWACVVRRRGEPVFVRIAGSGPDRAWTPEDDAIVDQARKALADGTSGEWQRSLARLAEQRLAPLDAVLGVRHLIVLPSPAMAGIPIEAIDAARPGKSPRYVVSYAPSGTMFAWLRAHGGEPSTRARRLLALGDPVPAPGGPGARGVAFAPLPGSRREVRGIAELFEQKDVFLGSDASEAVLDDLRGRDGLSRYSVIHLATHGRIDDLSPMNSRLWLSQDRLPDPASAPIERPIQDGSITAGDVLGTWRLDAELVSLSACESGLGRRSGGEGFVGFSQAFFLAGARSLLLSLWEVDDRATSLLMIRFYQNWLGRRPGLDHPMSRAEALHEAKQWLRRMDAAGVEACLPSPARGEPRPRRGAVVAGLPFEHPHYWAGFVLSGDPG